MALYLALSKFWPLHAFVWKALLRGSVISFRTNPDATCAILLAELGDCRTPERSAMLLAILKRLIIAAPHKLKDSSTFLSQIPGPSPLDRILICQKVLHCCFSIRRFAGELTIETARTEVRGPVATDSAQGLGINVLLSQHDQAMEQWLNEHEISPGSAQKTHILDSLQTAAQAGDSQAKYLLALAYSDGFGVSQDLSRCVTLLAEAAEAGNPNAQCTIGVMYCVGYIVEKDLPLGRKWLKCADERGSQVAHEALRRLT